MNRTILYRTFLDAKWFLAGACSLITLLVWARVWVASQIKVHHMQKLLVDIAPDFVRQILPVEAKVLSSDVGRLTLAFEEPMPAIMAFWAISRGSDVIAGELGRGSLEMTLAQPVRRLEWLLSHTFVTFVGAAAIACCAWLGTWIGVQSVELETPVSSKVLIPAAFNLFCLGIFLTGLATLLSSWDMLRSRVVGLVVGIYALQFIQKIVARATEAEYPAIHAVAKWSFVSAYEPQVYVYELRQGMEGAWGSYLEANGALLALGVVGIAIAAAVFQNRDLPAPL